MGLLVVGIVAYTYLYIRGIKRKQHETLEAYLALLNNAAESTNSPNEQSCVPQMKQEDDAMMRRIMAFIEENIGNGDASVGDMAAAAATSRSGLQRKLKQTMGITPQDLLREARIKHACQLLRQTTKTVAEVAYSCGFSDPKYFSRCFKQSIGMSPTDYKNTI
jgi:AraC-like DNA-binding protein